MAQNSQELINTINLVRSSRLLRQYGAATEHFPLPTTQAEMQQVLQDMVYAYTRNKFKGCRIRPGEEVVSVRLDAEIHQKARKLRSVIMENTEWKRWFEENHRHITDAIAGNSNAFQGENYLEYSIQDDSHFLRIPFVEHRLRNFRTEGLLRIFQWIDQEYQKDTRLSALYGQTVELMETEIRRREEARRERIERERTSYLLGLRQRLIKPIYPEHFDRSSINAEDKFKAKMYDYCVGRGIDPAYAEELNPQAVLPNGTGVRIIAQEGSREEGWFVVPMFGGYDLPEGFILKDRWGKVSGYNVTDKRSRNGTAPIVLDEFVFCSFNMDQWRHTIPAEYEALREASVRLRAEADAEALQAQEEYEANRARLEEEQRSAKEARLEVQRAELRDRLARQREQLNESPKPELKFEHPPTPAVESSPDDFEEEEEEEDGEEFVAEAPPARSPQEVAQMQVLSDSIRSQLNRKTDAIISQLESLEHQPGIYINSRGLPTERYIVVTTTGLKKFFRESPEAIEFARALNIPRENLNYVYDYWNPTTQVQYI